MIDREEFQKIKEKGLRGLGISDDDIETLMCWVELGIKYEKTINKIKYSKVNDFQIWQKEQEEIENDVDVFDYFRHLSNVIEND